MSDVSWVSGQATVGSLTVPRSVKSDNVGQMGRSGDRLADSHAAYLVIGNSGSHVQAVVGQHTARGLGKVEGTRTGPSGERPVTSSRAVIIAQCLGVISDGLGGAAVSLMAVI